MTEAQQVMNIYGRYFKRYANRYDEMIAWINEELNSYFDRGKTTKVKELLQYFTLQAWFEYDLCDDLGLEHASPEIKEAERKYWEEELTIGKLDSPENLLIVAFFKEHGSDYEFEQPFKTRDGKWVFEYSYYETLKYHLRGIINVLVDVGKSVRRYGKHSPFIDSYSIDQIGDYSDRMIHVVIK